jgi:hypothetical protein
VKDVLKYAAENKTSLTRIMLDNMVVPLPNGDVDVSMLKDAVQLINGRFETEVCRFNFARQTFSYVCSASSHTILLKATGSICYWHIGMLKGNNIIFNCRHLET